MTTTPTVWKAEFTANAGFTAGAQFSPVTIGLATGRFLTVWGDSDNNVDDDPFNDIVGRIFGFQGNPDGAPFQLNLAHFLDIEIDPAIAALPDGGFVVVFEDRAAVAGGDSAIRFQRFDAAGAPVTSGTIASGNIGGVVNLNPSIAVFANGDFAVSYQELSGGDTDVITKIVNGGTNIVGGPLAGGQNSSDIDANPDTVVLSNGNILTAYEEDDSGVTGIETYVIGAPLNFQVTATGTDPHAAALTGDGYVVVWQDGANNGDIRAEVRNNAGGVVTLNFLVKGGANTQNEPEVVALKDGGFFVVWDDDTAGLLQGQRFSSTGAVIGTTFTIASGLNITDPELGLTDDGRILVTFNNDLGEISQVILDPRDNVINGDNTSEIITSRIDGATVNGLGGNDTLFGFDGADTLDGGAGADTMRGGQGNDTYVVDNPDDIVDETGGSGIDSIVSAISFNLGDIGHVKGSAENLTLIGAALNGTGNALANVIIGDAAANILDGQAGADTMRGLGGSDNYIVDNAGDTIDETAIGSDGIDTVFASVSFALADGVENLALTGNASIKGTGNALANVITGNNAANILDGQAGADTMRGLGGSDNYIVDNAGDTIDETAIGSDGIDTVFASVNFALADGVENLKLTGNASINGTGNALANVITGNNAASILIGGAGADGFAFVTAFNKKTNADSLIDFSHADDTILLDNEVFRKLTKEGALKGKFFHEGKRAHDGNDRIIYNEENGRLIYDKNGDHKGKAVTFAILEDHLDLNKADFFVL